MPTHGNAVHHLDIRRRMYKNYEKFPHPTLFGRIIDKIIYAGAVILPLFNLIQLYQIWITRSVAGLSLVSWIGFTFFSLIWVIYGIVHKEKPIIALNAGLFIAQLLIVISIIHF